MRHLGRIARARLLIGASAAAIICSSGAAMAQEKPAITIAPQPLAAALYEFGGKTGTQVIFPSELAAAKRTAGVAGASDERVALTQLLTGTGLTFRREGDVFVILEQEGGSAGPQDDGVGGNAVDALIVTAQKREEAIQDVPIAISAFSQKALEEQKIEGGYDLLKAIPNVTFSKSNFSSYNFSIRGVGTKAVSATTDPGVAVAFNNTTLIQNRLFEQEYYDLERVEVLRGPQGTLYGRNATSGVINVISAKPDLNDFEGSIKGEIGNYDSRRLVGMLNVPLIDDVLAVRLAAAGTQRSGYDYNSITGNNVNGRELWSARLTVAYSPTDNLRSHLTWEHFEEDDDRSRTGKQLCKRDPGLQTIGNTPVVNGPVNAYTLAMRPALFSQACLPVNLYDDEAFGTPNGLALPFVFGALVIGDLYPVGQTTTGQKLTLIDLADPYGGLMQSRDLRTIASFRDPRYVAKADLLDLTLELDLTEAITLISQTVYNKDEVYSFQDYNRFNTKPVFNDTSTLVPSFNGDFRLLAPGGVFCDPQLGCSSSIAGFDVSQADGRQFSQELRLQTDLDGPLQFSAGANYTNFKTEVDYYVFYNLITALALTPPFFFGSNPEVCTPALGMGSPRPIDDPFATCPYVDPNPIESINGEGHNYFRSRNPYKLTSAAAFGEVYWQFNDALKLTAGLRYTKDKKRFIPVPSQILLAPGAVAGGTVNRGYPEKPPIEQEWGEFTGRLGLDWKPVLPFTDETMLYGFYSRGYKGGGANPPSPGFATLEEAVAIAEAAGNPIPPFSTGLYPVLSLTSVEYGPTFEPEFVDAFEVGAKNTLLGGALTFNATGFYYDYKDYQVSQIRDRTAVNENFDAKIWGLEFETLFAPSRNFRLNANLGYLETQIADGETSIDIMNRTQSNPNYVVVKPWAQLPSNCVVPVGVAESWAIAEPNFAVAYWNICGGLKGLLSAGQRPIDPNPAFGNGTQQYNPDNYPELNGGAGIRAELGGNELPNAPHWTTNIGAQYGRDILDGSWRVVMRGDAYWQSQSWARVYNAVNDKLHGWYNFNVSVRVENEDLGLAAEFYVKNLLDKSPITDAFLNSDDTGLTTNVFVLDPRLIGFSLRKTF